MKIWANVTFCLSGILDEEVAEAIETLCSGQACHVAGDCDI